MTGFEPGISGVRSDRYTNFGTTYLLSFYEHCVVAFLR